MSDPLDFSGKTVLVVGGSSGIGNGIAQAFRARGARVHVWGTRASAAHYRDQAAPRQAGSGQAGSRQTGSRQTGSDLTGLHYDQVDVSDAGAIERYAAPFEALDVLVLSQGVVRYGQAEFESAPFRDVVEINLNSVMTCCMRFYPLLKSTGGSVITVSSTAAFHSTRGNPAYNASKAGLVGLTRTLGEAWARDGVRVNGIAPGFVATKLTEVTTRDPERTEKALRRIPLRRMGTVGEMAGAALFLASPLASYVIGQTLPVDGGLVLGG
ncbi:3-oxoacyl-ACP reductase [Alcanivorax sp. N3-2A]|nr:3-oxoacyl-ACP reductase [Alcanivorax sp. N3-2A]|tara:strand:- start:49614 stop:50417 length:804 start_codon:yes stop_codon:yes gene_type:complete